MLIGFCRVSCMESRKDVIKLCIIKQQFTVFIFNLQEKSKTNFIFFALHFLLSNCYTVFMNYILVPLGNPDKEYERTRHNAGRLVCENMNNEFTCEVFIPKLYMNENGKDVADYLKYHDDTEVIVIYDDKDLPFGKFRISHDRGDGGHNGLKSIINHLGKKDFVRIRVGIAHKDTDGKKLIPLFGEAVQKYVMANCTDEELNLIKEISPKIKEAVDSIVNEGFAKAMEKFN